MNEYVNNPANKAYLAKPDCCSTHSKPNSSHKNQVSIKSEIYELQWITSTHTKVQSLKQTKTCKRWCNSLKLLGILNNFLTHEMTSATHSPNLKSIREISNNPRLKRYLIWFMSRELNRNWVRCNQTQVRRGCKLFLVTMPCIKFSKMNMIHEEKIKNCSTPTNKTEVYLTEPEMFQKNKPMLVINP